MENPSLSSRDDVQIDCAICLSQMIKEENPLTTLRCNHVFHTECIEHWYVSSGKERCPICRSSRVEGVEGAEGAEGGEREDNEREERVIEVPFENELPFLSDLEFTTDPLYGTFTTDNGDNIFIYESPMGIVMIRTTNNPLSLPTPPQGTMYVSLPQAARATGSSSNQNGRVGRFRIFSRLKRKVTRVWRSMRRCFRNYFSLIHLMEIR